MLRTKAPKPLWPPGFQRRAVGDQVKMVTETHGMGMESERLQRLTLTLSTHMTERVCSPFDQGQPVVHLNK